MRQFFCPYLVYGCLSCMNKHEAADFLKVSTKTIERYVAAGKLRVKYVEKKAVFDSQELAMLKENLETPVHRTLVVKDDSICDSETNKLSLSVAPNEQLVLVQLLQQLVKNEQNKCLYQKLTLTLKEAQQVTGLSRKGMLQAAFCGHLKAKKQGGRWKFRYQDLIIYVDAYFEGNFEDKGLNGKSELIILPGGVSE